MKKRIVPFLILILLTSCAYVPSETPVVFDTATPPPTTATPVPSAPPANPTPEQLPGAPDEPETAQPVSIPQTDDEIDELLSQVFVYNDLIDLADLNAGFIFNLTYATEDNFLGTVLYETPLCLAHIDLARALLKAQAQAVEQGLCLVIYDAYRPMSVQATMYELTPSGKKAYVAKPGASANHPKGVAIDCTLADSEGVLLPMPSDYDELSKRASVSYTGGTAEETANRDLLIEIMSNAGLKVASGEWWHFAVSNAKSYDGLDVSFDEFISHRTQ